MAVFSSCDVFHCLQLLDFNLSIQAWKSVNFLGHFLMLAIILVSMVNPPKRPRKKEAVKAEKDTPPIQTGTISLHTLQKVLNSAGDSDVACEQTLQCKCLSQSCAYRPAPLDPISLGYISMPVYLRFLLGISGQIDSKADWHLSGKGKFTFIVGAWLIV